MPRYSREGALDFEMMPPGRIVDTPAGEGVLTGRLWETREVVAVDIDEAYFKLSSVVFKSADLNRARSPFA